MITNFLAKNKSLIFFWLILFFLGGLFRFYNLNWDLGNYFHPDERNIANAVIKIKFFNQMDPGFFAYGGFSIYLYRAAADLVHLVTDNISWIANWGNINIIGRSFSALFSTLTIIPIYFLAKTISNKRIGLLSVVLYVFTVGSIQTAHYDVTESLITLIAVNLCLFSILNYKNLTIKKTVILGIIMGVGLAAKISAISFIVIPFTSYALNFFKEKRISSLKKILTHLLAFLILTSIVFTLLSPFTFLDWNKFIESMTYESGVATGSLPVVYTLQFDNTLPYLFQLKNLFWQMGIVTIFSFLGLLTLLFELIRSKNRFTFLIFIIFPIIYFAYVGAWHTKFIRYMVPLIPFLIIIASIFLNKMRSKFNLLGNVLIYFSVITSILWCLAFFSIYLKPQTRIAASKWVYANVPPGEKILNEQWDDGLPIPINQFNPSEYQITSLAMYDQDNPNKINYLATNLSNSDYIIFNSRRLYGTLIHLNKKYPITSKYYKLLFEGKLGYKKEEEFSSYPSLLGITINDDSSEETFQVYEHPKVIIFKNEERFPEKKLIQLLND